MGRPLPDRMGVGAGGSLTSGRRGVCRAPLERESAGLARICSMRVTFRGAFIVASGDFESCYYCCYYYHCTQNTGSIVAVKQELGKSTGTCTTVTNNNNVHSTIHLPVVCSAHLFRFRSIPPVNPSSPFLPTWTMVRSSSHLPASGAYPEP